MMSSLAELLAKLPSASDGEEAWTGWLTRAQAVFRHRYQQDLDALTRAATLRSAPARVLATRGESEARVRAIKEQARLERERHYQAEIERVRPAVAGLLAQLQELHAPATPASAAVNQGERPRMSDQTSNKVFVVSGRDTEAADALCDFLRIIRLEVVSWEQATRLTGRGTPTTIDIVRAGIQHADAVVVLFTPDEEVVLREGLLNPGEVSSPRMQPRPNVLIEAGWVFGQAEGKAVIVEVAGFTHAISDFDGLNTVRMKNVSSLNQLKERLETAGCRPRTDDSKWTETSRFAALFRPAPPKQILASNATTPPQPPRGLSEKTVVLMLRHKLPHNAGFYLFEQLNRQDGIPPDVPGSLWVRAAKEEDRLEDATDEGLMLNQRQLFGRL